MLVEPPDGGAPLLLAKAAGADQEAVVGRPAGGRVALLIWSDDFEAARARLIAAGARFEEEPRREVYGTVAVWCDPWGNRWDLLGPP